uniref:Uncharacterized protein n=1 Tax=Oryza brachyantha TaxID=4533 RepID=J3MQ11_ORYBR
MIRNLDFRKPKNGKFEIENHWHSKEIPFTEQISTFLKVPKTESEKCKRFEIFFPIRHVSMHKKELNSPEEEQSFLHSVACTTARSVICSKARLNQWRENCCRIPGPSRRRRSTTGCRSRRRGTPSGGTPPSTMSPPWSAPASSASPSPCPSS